MFSLAGQQITDKIEKLAQKSFNMLSFSDTYISGTVNCEKSQILFLPIPYNENWKVLINDKETRIYRANAGFMAVMLPVGYSNVELRYESPAFNVGVVTTMGSLIIFTALILMRRHRKQNSR